MLLETHFSGGWTGPVAVNNPRVPCESGYVVGHSEANLNGSMRASGIRLDNATSETNNKDHAGKDRGRGGVEVEDGLRASPIDQHKVHAGTVRS